MKTKASAKTNSMTRSPVPLPLVVIALALACFGLLPKTQAVTPAADAGDAEVRDTLQRLYTAWSDLDPAKAAPFYAKDADLVFFDIAPMKYTSWSEYVSGVPDAFAPYKSGKFTLNDDLRVHRQGSSAWATATWRADLVKKAGGTEHMEGRYTAVLEKRGNEWLVVHEHMSVPPPPTER
jgi:ketosteroid isomerase-like protein